MFHKAGGRQPAPAYCFFDKNSISNHSGKGKVFLETAGSVVKRELKANEVLKVDTGNVVAFSRGVKYEVETVKGFKNIFFGGEGLFLTKLTGPGTVYLQTLTMQNVAGRLIPYLPTGGNN